MSVRETGVAVASPLGGASVVVINSPHGTWTGLEIQRSLGSNRVGRQSAAWSDPERLAAELPPDFLFALHAGVGSRHKQLAQELRAWLPAEPISWQVPQDAGATVLGLVAACTLCGLTGEGIRFAHGDEIRLVTEQGDYSLRTSSPNTATRWAEVEATGFAQRIAEIVATSAWAAAQGADIEPNAFAQRDERWEQGSARVGPGTDLQVSPEALERVMEEAGLPDASIYAPLHASGATSFDAMILAEVLTGVLGRKVTMRELVSAERIVDLARYHEAVAPEPNLRLTPEQELFASLEALEPGSEKYRAVYAFDLPASVDRGRLCDALLRVHEVQDVLHRELQLNGEGVWTVGRIISFHEVFAACEVETRGQIVAVAEDARARIDFGHGGAPYRIVECDHYDGSTTLVLNAHHIAFDEGSLAFYLREVGKSYDDSSYPPEQVATYDGRARPDRGSSAESTSESEIEEFARVLNRAAPPYSWNSFRFDKPVASVAMGSWVEERSIDAVELGDKSRLVGCLPLDFIASGFLYALSVFHESERPVVGMPVSLRPVTDPRGTTGGPQVAIAPTWGITRSSVEEAESPVSVSEARSDLLAHRAVLRQVLKSVGNEVVRSPSGSLFTGFLADVNEPTILSLGGANFPTTSILIAPPKFPCSLFLDRTRQDSWRLRLEVDRTIIDCSSLDAISSRFDEYLQHLGLSVEGGWTRVGGQLDSAPADQDLRIDVVDDTLLAAVDGGAHTVLLGALSDVFEQDFDLGVGFVQQGGDSLTAVRVANALRKQGYLLKPIELLRRQTLGEVEFVRGKQETSRPEQNERQLATTSFPVSHMQEGLIYESLETPDAYRFTYVAMLRESTDITILRRAVEDTIAEMPQLTAVPQYGLSKTLTLRSVETWRVRWDEHLGEQAVWVDSPPLPHRVLR